ncbi:hypothetical protein AB0O90_12235 [Microbacterium testaceum]|uniref:hypothetical protein n=1 Tax=Microbacterium testaceum TaxID=2033 RepID=UPI00343A8D08
MSARRRVSKHEPRNARGLVLIVLLVGWLGYRQSTLLAKLGVRDRRAAVALARG